MFWLILTLIIVVLAFGLVLLIGAPFLPTLNNQIEDIFELIDLKPGDLLLELGSGDGRILRAAAKRGIKTIGYEINPLLVLYSQFLSWPHRKLITIHWKNFWNISVASADGIYIFLLDPYMNKLDKKIMSEITKPIKVVSFTFAFPNRQPIKRINGLRLYLFKPEI
jgi:16S rRNA A1518/A1519 N6-dimethyltransferase RsmA/KsgA/DIM1 with predicted DNA glycosylase/AP lyase activity